jgi:hypothetical protein
VSVINEFPPLQSWYLQATIAGILITVYLSLILYIFDVFPPFLRRGTGSTCTHSSPSFKISVGGVSGSRTGGESLSLAKERVNWLAIIGLSSCVVSIAVRVGCGQDYYRVRSYPCVWVFAPASPVGVGIIARFRNRPSCGFMRLFRNRYRYRFQQLATLWIIVLVVDYSSWWTVSLGGPFLLVGYSSWWTVSLGGLFLWVDYSSWWSIPLGETVSPDVDLHHESKYVS